MGSNSKRRREEKQRKRAEASRRRATADGWPSNAYQSASGPEPDASELDRQRARRAIDLAIAALRTGNPTATAIAVEAICAIPASGNRHPVADELGARLVSTVRTLFQDGWQPLDLAHVITRELGIGHRALLVRTLAAEGRLSNTAALHPAWRAQLARLGCAAGDSARREVTAPVIDANRHLRRDVELGIATLSYAMRLPKLPLLLPPPGSPEARMATMSTPPSHLDEKILARVRALLAKAESTTFEDEADAFTAKAQQLMARHAIDLAMLGERTGHRGTAVARRIHLDDPYAEAKSSLLAVVANENRCSSVYSIGIGFSTVVGFEVDLDIVELLFTSLLTQATSSMIAAGRSVDRNGRSRTRSFRQSFLIAFAIRIGERLGAANTAASEEARTEMGDTFLPVLASRIEEVAAKQDEIFPETIQRPTSISNTAGWLAGRDAADRARIDLPVAIGQGGRA